MHPGHRSLPEGDGPGGADGAVAQPAYFGDLNLDQVVDAVVAGLEEYDLRPFFHARLADEDAVVYRHEVFADLERPEVFDVATSFARSMRDVRAHLAQAAKLRHPLQRARWLLDAMRLYCGTLRALRAGLAGAGTGSRGLTSLAAHLDLSLASDAFTSLEAEADAVHRGLAAVGYLVHLQGNRVRVQRYDGEADHSGEVLATFERFRRGAARDYRLGFREWPEMNHVEAQILDRVALLHPAEFAALEDLCARRADFVDPVVAAFERELQFYLGYLEWLRPLREAGLPFCYPEVSARTKEVSATAAFDAALAGKLVPDQVAVVGNDFHLVGPERVLVVSGPNQGGKTTFARTFGQLHHLAALGCPVPGRAARLYLCDAIHTHFEREEDLSVTGGKLEDDLVRARDILLAATPDSVVILNEIFTSTTLRDATFLGRKVIERVVELGLLCVYVTFVEELARLGDATVSMVSTVLADDPSQRTYKVVRRPADGRSYAIAIAEKYGLTYDRLHRRISP